MNFYPSDGSGPIEEVWDGEKLTRGENLDQLTPMAISPHDSSLHYFVNELCELENEELFLPRMFFKKDGGLWARGFQVTCEALVSKCAGAVSKQTTHHI